MIIIDILLLLGVFVVAIGCLSIGYFIGKSVGRNGHK